MSTPQRLRHHAARATRRMELATTYGDCRFPRALMSIADHAGDDRAMPRIGEREPWHVVQRCDPELYAWLRKIPARDHREWTFMHLDVAKTQKNAALQARRKVIAARDLRLGDPKRDHNPEVIAQDISPDAKRLMRFTGIEAWAYCARKEWAGRSPRAKVLVERAALKTVNLLEEPVDEGSREANLSMNLNPPGM